MRNRSRSFAGTALTIGALTAAAVLLSGNGPAAGGVTVTVNGLRNTNGMVRACITAVPRLFPHCDRDPAAQKLSVPARNGAVLNFPGLPAGRYAIAVIHDENGNGKMDKGLILPKEGFGFSRDAPVRMGPPPFSAAAFDVAAAVVRTTIRIRYM